MRSAHPRLIRLRTVSSSRIRLVCLPHAGASAHAFRQWDSLLPVWVDLIGVELPGRGSRICEPPIDCWNVLLKEASCALASLAPMPTVYFGHSLGALIAYELARTCTATSVVVSGCIAAHLPLIEPPIHGLSDCEFLKQIRMMRGTPDDVFKDPELLELLLPVLRADFRLAETYRYFPGRAIKIPLLALGGTEDRSAPEEQVKAWACHTEGPFDYRRVPGDHFFIQTAAEPVTEIIENWLSQFVK